MTRALGMVRQGVFTWDMKSNVVLADHRVADCFNIPAADARLGLPLDAYLPAIHPADREATAWQFISQGGNQSFEYRYRTIRADGSVMLVRAAGECFTDRAGKPASQVGTISATPSGNPEDDRDVLVDLCIEAYKRATQRGKPMLKHLLAMALLELGQEEARRD